MPATYRHRTGFSLVELLVVIAILTLLVALLFPVVSSTRLRAVQSSCANNLRQVGTAVHLYAQDYDGLYPYGVNARSKEIGASSAPPGSLMGLPLYQGLLKPYTHSLSIFACPGDSGFNDLHPNAFDAWGSSYFYNESLVFIPSERAKENPSQTPLCEDAIGSWHCNDLHTDPAFQRVNVVFNDLHVKSVLQSDALPLGPE